MTPLLAPRELGLTSVQHALATTRPRAPQPATLRHTPSRRVSSFSPTLNTRQDAATAPLATYPSPGPSDELSGHASVRVPPGHVPRERPNDSFRNPGGTGEWGPPDELELTAQSPPGNADQGYPGAVSLPRVTARGAPGIRPVRSKCLYARPPARSWRSKRGNCVLETTVPYPPHPVLFGGAFHLCLSHPFNM